MPKRPDRQPAEPRRTGGASKKGSAGGTGPTKKKSSTYAVPRDQHTGRFVAAASWGGHRPAPPDQGIDYTDIPDVGDDDAYWKGGRVGPVLPMKAAERPS